MDRAEKKELVTTLNQVFKTPGVIVVAHNKGLTVNQVNDLRGKMAQAGVTVKVAKNRLAKLALDGTDAAGIKDLFTGPTMVAYAADPVSAPKVASDFAKGNEKFVVLGGALGKTILDAAAVKALAELPSLDQLRGEARWSTSRRRPPALRVCFRLLQANWPAFSTPMPPRTKLPDGTPATELVQTD